MNLQGSITHLQDTVTKLYVELEHRFKENQLIRDLWSAMAHDISQQKRSMSLIPPSFWHRLKAEQDGLARAISESKRQITESETDPSLRGCFERALSLAEPTILKIYVPVIRKLRGNWIDQALDFYIMVKAHLARITRVTQMFAGDPILIQRSNLLLQSFEKDVQEPQIVPQSQAQKSHKARVKQEKHAAKPQKKKPSPKPAQLAKHSKSHHSRTKPLVKKIKLAARRAHR